MRIENHIHIRHIMLYHFEKDWNAAQSFRDLNELFGEGTISKSQVERWFKKFKSGDTNLVDEEGRGRPSNFDDQALLVAVEEDESLTTRMLAEDFNVDHSTIVRLKKLGKVWKLAGWVPHELSDNNKAERVRIFTNLLQRNEQTPFLKNLVTGDESWLLFRNVKKRRFAFRQVFHPMEYRKTSTVRRQCGVFGGTEAESSTGKSSQTGFVIGGMTTMSVNSGGFWTKMASGN